MMGDPSPVFTRGAHNTVIDLLAAATAALSHAVNVNAVVLFVKLVAVSTVIALAIATAIEQKWRR
jgi:hypothetical protein